MEHPTFNHYHHFEQTFCRVVCLIAPGITSCSAGGSYDARTSGKTIIRHYSKSQLATACMPT